MEALKAAVRASSLEDVFRSLKELQEKGARIKDDREEIIQAAVESRNVEIVAALLGAKIIQSPLAEQFNTQQTLRLAITASKDLAITKLLIRAGYEPFLQDHDTMLHNALHWAAETGDLPLLEYIWDLANSRGISINVQDAEEWAPLHFAAYHLNDAAVQFLLQQGANPNILADDGSSAFSLLLQYYGDTSKPEYAGSVKTITEALIAAGLRLEDATYRGRTPLMDASYCGAAAAVKVLLSAGANVDALDPINQTALHVACDEGDLECIRLLLAAGADFKARDAAGNTPLHAAFNIRLNGDERIDEAVIELINHGADVNAKNYAGETPLHVACRNIWEEGVGAVSALLQSGADVRILAAGKGSCLHLVVKRFCEHCSGALPWNQYRVNVAKQRAACALGFIQRLLKAGVKADALNLDGLTPIAVLKEKLPAAVLNRHKDIFAPLIVTLIKGGDFSSWGSVPKGNPGLGSAIKVLWNKRPEMLCYLFAKLSPDEQERVKMTLRCLQRYLPVEDARMQVIFHLFSSPRTVQ